MASPEKQFLKQLELFIRINDTLLKKSNDNKPITFLECYVFQATSYAISLMRNIFYNLNNSISTIFTIRCLIESLAAIKMEQAHKVNPEANILIEQSPFIAEYHVYKRYPELDGPVFHLEEVKKNYENAKEIFKKVGNLTDKQFKEIEKSKLPFLLDENLTYSKMVDQYYPEMSEAYHLSSVMLHPNDLNVTARVIENYNFDHVKALLFIALAQVIDKNSEKLKIDSDKTLAGEDNIYCNDLNQQYLSYAEDSCIALNKLESLIRKKLGDCTMAAVIKDFAYLIKDIAIDKIFGFSELVKSKYKPALEMISLVDYFNSLSLKEDYQYIGQLFTLHTQINLIEKLKGQSENFRKQAYEIYIQYVKNISYDDFLEAFAKPIGFLPKTTSLNQFVYDFIDGFNPTNIKSRLSAKLLYDESQCLSHANGYMLLANTGAFMDNHAAIGTMESAICHVLYNYHKLWDLYVKLENDTSYKKLAYEIKKTAKIISQNLQSKIQLDLRFKDQMVEY